MSVAVIYLCTHPWPRTAEGAKKSEATAPIVVRRIFAGVGNSRRRTRSYPGLPKDGGFYANEDVKSLPGKTRALSCSAAWRHVIIVSSGSVERIGTRRVRLGLRLEDEIEPKIIMIRRRCTKRLAVSRSES